MKLLNWEPAKVSIATTPMPVDMTLLERKIVEHLFFNCVVLLENG